MKHLLLALLLLGNAAPLLANDEGGDGAYVPSSGELIRLGYNNSGQYAEYDGRGYARGSSSVYGFPQTYGNFRPNIGYATVPKPTQAYYRKGYTVYYGYTPVRVWIADANNTYAFGHPLAYFHQFLPGDPEHVDFSNYAVLVRHNQLSPGDYVALQQQQTRQQQYSSRQQANVTTVQNVRIRRTATGALTAVASTEEPGSKTAAANPASSPSAVANTASSATTAPLPSATMVNSNGAATLPPIGEKPPQ